MGPMLSALVDLQRIEHDLRDVKRKLKQGQMQVVRQERAIEQLNAALEAKREEIKQVRLEAARLELELRTKDDEIDKFRVALNGAKSNKDYSTILTHLNVTKADKSKLEDRILNLMTEIEGDEQSVNEAAQEVEQEQQKLEEIRTDVHDKQTTLREDLARLEQEHATAAEQVPARERDMFTRLAERYDGAAICEVRKLNPRREEYGCGGCFMNIPLQVVNSLMSRDETVICPSCGRMLVLEDSLSSKNTA